MTVIHLRQSFDNFNHKTEYNLKTLLVMELTDHLLLLSIDLTGHLYLPWIRSSYGG